MANSGNLYGTNRPGPKPVFTERMDLRLRPDQVQALARISSVIPATTSELVRMFIDYGTDAFESVPNFKSLPRKEPAPWESEQHPCSPPPTN